MDNKYILSVFEVDASNIVPGTRFYFCNETEDVTIGGQTYTRYPVEVTGYSSNIQNRFPEPKLVLANADNLITNLILTLNGLRGAKVTRRRFKDTDEYLPDIFFVDTYAETALTVELALRSPFQRGNLYLPKRRLSNLVN